MSTTNEYMLIFRGTDWHVHLSPEETQQVAGRMMDWFTDLKAAGKATGGRPLESTGKLVTGKNGRVVADGPFAESKEAIAGYFMLQVADIDEAVAIAKDCPTLAYGVQVEVRPLMDVCPYAKHVPADQQLAEAIA
jgi:hypothetical protein